jgi:hypothetical protein
MSKFFDNTVYPLASSLGGDEIFIIHQNDKSRTTDFDKVVDDILQPLVDNLLINDISDVNITNRQNGQVLMYMNNEWINSDINHGNLNDVNDVTILGAIEGQMLLWKGTQWENGFDPTLKGYIETEFDHGTVAGNCNINLINGNVQRLRVGGSVNIILPSIPTQGNNWNITLKVVSNGSDLPTFSATGATVKWNKNDPPTNIISADMVSIYIFTSDYESTSVYASLVWSEE